VAEDHFYPEIVNPETLESLENGEMGELVFTHLTKEAMPLLRYRTRDLTYLNDTPCDCGRTNVRMASVKGRSDDMLIIRGVNVFPSQVESVLLSIPEAKPHYLLVVERKGAMDTLVVKVEIDETYLSDEINAINILKNRIRHQVESTLGISIKLTIVEPKALERSEGKAKRVLDLRKEEEK
jgi:phenylacetate-CoA ligase